MADIFRKAALDTMSTPEQLDKQVKIMRPSVWIIFTAFVTALATFIIWSFTYRITNGVNLAGVVFTNNNVITSVADRDCMVTDVLVAEGEYVNIGDIIAVVSNSDLLSDISNNRFLLSLYDEKDSEYEKLYHEIETMVSNYIASTIIKSSSAGYIQTVKSMGSSVSAGDIIASVMSDNGYNEVVAYVPLQTANSLSLGMTAQISPTYAPREEYGYMSGVITAISDTPATEESIISKMGTLSYVENILPKVSYVEVRIRMDLDENSSNKYKWSNSNGENLPVDLGAECSIIIVTSEYLPVEMLLS